MENFNEYNLEIAKPEDAEGIFDLLHLTWLTTYPRVHSDPRYNITVEDIESKYTNREESVKRQTERLKKSDDICTWVIKNAHGNILGMCNVEKSESRIKAIYVDPNCQGKGLGGMLMKKAFEYLGEDTKIFLNVASYNENAIGFYKKHGFVESKLLPEIDRFIGGKVIPEMEMVRN